MKLEPDKPASLLKINSFDELMQQEKEILNRISSTHNGVQLFLIHPFMLLADIEVELSEQAREEIIQQEPLLSNLSATPYNALKASEEKQLVQFHLQGLFERRSK